MLGRLTVGTRICTLLWVALSLSVQLWSAQAAADPTSDGSVPVDNCTSIRLDGKCKPAPLSAEDNMRKATIQGRQIDVTKTLTLPEQRQRVDSSQCEARFTLAYVQMNDKIRVKMQVTNNDCIASGGEYQLRVRSVSEAQEIQTRTIDASWARTEEGPIKFTKYYAMEGDTDLVWVKIKSKRKTACICE